MVTAADLRAELARQRIRIYEIAPTVGMHPVKLGRVLNEQAPLDDNLASRIAAAVTRAVERRERR
jgi:plasmid maintenance system antidote protein VapI